jgi:hypothetical protein
LLGFIFESKEEKSNAYFLFKLTMTLSILDDSCHQDRLATASKADNPKERSLLLQPVLKLGPFNKPAACATMFFS